MFNSNNIISACLALVVLLSPTAVLAENDTPASQQPSSHEAAKKESSIETSADETKLRIGPGDPVAGKDKAALCYGCHGENGNSTDPQYPKLAGQYGIYIAKQIRNYLASTRSHQVMSGMAASVSDEDLADIAAYFASQPMMKGDHPSSNKIGKNLFENDDLSRMQVRCNSCHGATGKGQNPGNPVYPVIGGQHKDYLLAQLLNFRKGVRNNSPGGVMNITVHRLSDAELEALADYVSGL
jgi:cytochrome c553